MFGIQGALSTLGDHIFSIDCLSTSNTSAEIFYAKQVFYASAPILICLVSFFFWYIYGKCSQVAFFAKRVSPIAKTPKDKFIITVTTIIFLMYPTLCQQAFGNFNCKWIGAKRYLNVDLEEVCYEGRHLIIALTLGLGQILSYIIGLPALVLFFLVRNHGVVNTRESSGGAIDNDLFSKPVVLTRWGLFFKR